MKTAKLFFVFALLLLSTNGWSQTNEKTKIKYLYKKNIIGLTLGGYKPMYNYGNFLAGINYTRRFTKNFGMQFCLDVGPGFTETDSYGYPYSTPALFGGQINLKFNLFAKSRVQPVILYGIGSNTLTPFYQAAGLGLDVHIGERMVASFYVMPNIAIQASYGSLVMWFFKPTIGYKF